MGQETRDKRCPAHFDRETQLRKLKLKRKTALRCRVFALDLCLSAGDRNKANRMEEKVSNSVSKGVSVSPAGLICFVG